ncbi:MAG: DMT family transporter [Candidatus Helarchaeota archaeon]
MVEWNISLGILLAVIAYTCLYLGKGIQKFAIVGYTQKDAPKGEKGKHVGIWIGGLILTGAFMFIHLFALRYAPISVIAPFEGLGLLILCIFSYFILREPIDQMKAIGIIAIITGLTLTAVFTPDPNIIPAEFDLMLFIMFLIIIMSIFVILGFYSRRKNYMAAGVIFGSFAGAFMCFQTLTKRITWLPGFWYFIFIMFGFSIATLIMTNFGFLKADAVIVVPSFSAMSIILPTLLAIFLFNEPAIAFQWIGIIIIVLGIIFLTAFSKDQQSAEEV